MPKHIVIPSRLEFHVDVNRHPIAVAEQCGRIFKEPGSMTGSVQAIISDDWDRALVILSNDVKHYLAALKPESVKWSDFSVYYSSAKLEIINDYGDYRGWAGVGVVASVRLKI